MTNYDLPIVTIGITLKKDVNQTARIRLTVRPLLIITFIGFLMAKYLSTLIEQM